MSDFNFLHSAFDSKFSAADDLPTVFLVEDDVSLGPILHSFLQKKLGLPICLFSTPLEFLKYLETQNVGPFCLVTDIAFDEGGIDGLSLIDMLKQKNLSFVSIAMTGFASIESAINATKKGVAHYLTKPFDLEDLSSIILQALTQGLNYHSKSLGPQSIEEEKIEVSPVLSYFKIEKPTKEDMFQGMIGRSKKMHEVFERIGKVAEGQSTVLITGESGTGKELVAQAIHNLSMRARNPLIPVNCGAIPSELLESELFGHVKGAFTGAIANRKGRFELADRGTIFLDEIGDMPLLLQVKLLRVLQNKMIELVGGAQSIAVDVRIITATHRDLEKAVNEGNFRQDLFYRLNVIPIKIPALAERREDIPLLIAYFLSRFVSADGRNNIDFTDQALEILVGYRWPGNVRELENLIERLVILRGGSLIRPEDLPAKFLANRPQGNFSEHLLNLPDLGIDLKKTISDIEDSLIKQALDRTSGNKNQASKLLFMNRTTLIEKMKKKGLPL